MLSKPRLITRRLGLMIFPLTAPLGMILLAISYSFQWPSASQSLRQLAPWFVVTGLASAWTIAFSLSSSTLNLSLILTVVLVAALTLISNDLRYPPHYQRWLLVGLAATTALSAVDFMDRSADWRPFSDEVEAVRQVNSTQYTFPSDRPALAVKWRPAGQSRLTLSFTAQVTNEVSLRLTPWYAGMSDEDFQSLTKTVYVTPGRSEYSVVLELPEWVSSTEVTDEPWTLLASAVAPTHKPAAIEMSSPTLSLDGQAIRPVLTSGIRARGLYRHPNLLAHSAVAIAALLLTTSSAAVGLVGLGLVTTIVTLSGSRTALFALVILFVFFVGSIIVRSFRAKRRLRLLVGIVLFGTVIACFALLVSGALPKLDHTPLRVLSFSEQGSRTEIWGAALSGISQTPLLGHGSPEIMRSGVGPLEPEVFVAPHSHNFILQILWRYGAFGAAILIIGAAYWALRIVARRGFLGIGSVIAIASLQLLDFTLLSIGVLFPVVLLAVSTRGQTTEQSEAGPD